MSSEKLLGIIVFNTLKIVYDKQMWKTRVNICDLLKGCIFLKQVFSLTGLLDYNYKQLLLIRLINNYSKYLITN